MRWERLFDDLEAELEAAETAELESEIAERTRFERARLRLVDRLRGSVGRHVGVRVVGAGQLTGEIRAVGVDWLLVRPAEVADRLVPNCSAARARPDWRASSAAEGSEGVVAARFTLAAVLRGLARDRTVVTITLVDGSASDRHDRAGRRGPAGALRPAPRRARLGRPGSTTVRRSIPLAALAVVREH